MKELDILNGFITAPSTYNFITKPWLSYLGNKVIATNGRILISVPTELTEGVYRRWDNIWKAEPHMFGIGELTSDDYVSLKDFKFNKVIEETYKRIDTNDNSIYPIDIELHNESTMRFDFWQLVPIYNALTYFDEKPYIGYQGRFNTLLIKTVNGIQMAIMPLKAKRRTI